MKLIIHKNKNKFDSPKVTIKDIDLDRTLGYFGFLIDGMEQYMSNLKGGLVMDDLKKAVTELQEFKQGMEDKNQFSGNANISGEYELKNL